MNNTSPPVNSELPTCYLKVEACARFLGWLDVHGTLVAIIGPAISEAEARKYPYGGPWYSYGWYDPGMDQCSGGVMSREAVARVAAEKYCFKQKEYF